VPGSCELHGNRGRRGEKSAGRELDATRTKKNKKHRGNGKMPRTFRGTRAGGSVKVDHRRGKKKNRNYRGTPQDIIKPSYGKNEQEIHRGTWGTESRITKAVFGF